MKSIHFSLLLVYCCLCSFLSSDTLDGRIIRALSTFSKNFPQEKVYLQFDKGYYASGETIWFKGYITLQDFPTQLSTILYVELMDDSGNILKRDVLPIAGGISSGSFMLARNFKGGNYRIRAYTAWMLNFDEAFLFHRDFSVFRPDEGSSTSIPIKNIPVIASKSLASYTVQFFPEGGDLVNGVTSVVAFKADDSGGTPVEVHGKIIDNFGNAIASVESVHDGMGYFQMIPVKGKSYQLVVHSPGYDNKSFMLPRAKESGIVLHIQPPDGSSHVYFELSRSEADKEKYNRLKLVFQMQGARIHITDIDFDRGLYGGMLKLDQWPSGIMQVTVFDTTGLPLAERLFFVRHSDQLDVQLNIRQLGLKSRAKNTFQITWPQSVGADFSISVTDEDMIRQSFNGDNIISNLLLTSDIKGEVYHPGWYFRNEDSATLRGLDLVMMTNGWRRFTWEKILNNHFPKIVFPADTAGLVIKGRALSMDRGTINMIIKSPSDSISYYVAAPVNQLGDFMIPNLNFHDTAQLYFQGLQGKDETIGDQIHLNGSFLDNLTQVPISVQLHPADIDSVHLTNFLGIALERNHSGYISDNSSILLNEVTVTGRIRSLIQQLDDRYSSPSFKESAYKSFDLLDDTIANPDILAFLEGQIGLSIYTDNQGIRHPVWKSCQPSIYLNEQLTNVEEISTLPLNEIALIKVFQPPFSAGSGNDKCGAIAVYSRKGSDRNTGRGLLKGRKMGYSLVRQFYSPDYEATNINHDLNDERTTLYWNPDLRPDNISHSTTVSFFNNDFTKRYHVVIEGMNNTGKFGRLDTVIEDN